MRERERERDGQSVCPTASIRKWTEGRGQTKELEICFLLCKASCEQTKKIVNKEFSYRNTLE